MPSVAPSWESISAAKIAARDTLIPAAWKLSPKLALTVEEGGPTSVLDIPAQSGILSERELALTEMDAQALVDGLAKGELKSVEVTEAFCKRSAIACQLTNCLTEIFYAEALEHAAELDAYFAKEGKPNGPLHGLPVSLKDNFKVKGYDSTVGFIAWCNEPMETESVLTTLLRKSGAVLFCKTNTSTAMMMGESYNNVWGYTTSPLNRLTSSGGSSGGESALLAMRGAPFGVGTDIGGSIRLPASFCGLYSLKPSFGRFPTHGARSGLPGQEAVLSINGPMSADLSALSLYAKTVVDSEPWLQDPRMIPIPWREVTLPEKLSIGVIYDDGFVRPTPPIARAIDHTVSVLRAAGHDVKPFPVPKRHNRAPELLNEFFLADGGSNIKDFIKQGGEPFPIGLQQYAEQDSPFGANKMWDLHAERHEVNKELCDAWTASSSLTESGRPFDILITPVHPYAAFAHHDFTYVGYTGVWNIADYPGATLPTGLMVDATLDAKNPGFQPRNKMEKEIWEKYDPTKILGTSATLQLVGRRLQEEMVLAITAVVDAALKAAASSA